MTWDRRQSLVSCQYSFHIKLVIFTQFFYTLVFHEHAIPHSDQLRKISEFERSKGKSDPKNPFLTTGLYKIGKCLPAECSEEDVSIGGRNFLVSESQGLYNLSADIVSPVLSCQSPLEAPVSIEAGDGVMIGLLVIFAILILAGTLVDLAVNVLKILDLPQHHLAMLQGFSAYSNSIKILNTKVSGDLSCINGLKYISISWIVLGHVLWEHCNVSGYGAFSLSTAATGR